MSDTIYINGVYCKKKNYGIGISGKASDLIAEIQKHTNSKGYIRFELKERREPDKQGNTHYMVLDTWEPQQGQQRSNNSPATYGERVPPLDEPFEDMPF